MSRIAFIAIAAMALGSPADAADQTVCRSNKERAISYTGGVDGFRPGENFIREWVRETSKIMVGAPQFYEKLRFNGDDAAFTYSYEIDDRRPKSGAPEDDKVHAIDGRTQTGAPAYIQTFWERDEKTLMAHILCNDARRQEGDCRIGFEDARRLGVITAEGPVVVLFMEGSEAADVCIQPLGEPGPWRLILDGAASPKVETPCAGRALAAAFAKAGTAEAAMPSTFEHNKGEIVTNTLHRDDIQAALDLAAYVRQLNYARTPEQSAWLDGLIADSKAAFAKAGDDLRDCTVREPPT